MNTTTLPDAASHAPLVSLQQQARWLPADMGGYLSRLMALAPKPVYKDKILIPYGINFCLYL